MRNTLPGIAVLNVHASFEPGPVVEGLARTWLDVFPDAQRVEGPDQGGFSSRLHLARQGGGAVEAPLELMEKMPRMLQPAWHMIASNLEPLPEPSKGRVWTDNHVPVEVLTERAERRLRAELQ